jgi:hypothetical protein
MRQAQKLLRDTLKWVKENPSLVFDIAKAAWSLIEWMTL